VELRDLQATLAGRRREHVWEPLPERPPLGPVGLALRFHPPLLDVHFWNKDATRAHCEIAPLRSCGCQHRPERSKAFSPIAADAICARGRARTSMASSRATASVRVGASTIISCESLRQTDTKIQMECGGGPSKVKPDGPANLFHSTSPARVISWQKARRSSGCLRRGHAEEG
jgi:hypothetical protein